MWQLLNQGWANERQLVQISTTQASLIRTFQNLNTYESVAAPKGSELTKTLADFVSFQRESGERERTSVQTNLELTCRIIAQLDKTKEKINNQLQSNSRIMFQEKINLLVSIQEGLERQHRGIISNLLGPVEVMIRKEPRSGNFAKLVGEDSANYAEQIAFENEIMALLTQEDESSTPKATKPLQRSQSDNFSIATENRVDTYGFASTPVTLDPLAWLSPSNQQHERKRRAAPTSDPITTPNKKVKKVQRKPN